MTPEAGMGIINIEVMTRGRLDMRKMRGMRGQISSGTTGTNTNGNPKSRLGSNMF